jgi:intein-encoded DNA endonuclease-like protein
MYAVLRYFSHPTMRQVIEELKSKFEVKVSPPTFMKWIKNEKKIRANLTNRQRIFPTTLKQLDKLKKELGVND